jgi:hypothetical protein
VCDDRLEIVCLLLEQLAQLVVFFDLLLVLDDERVAISFSLAKLWASGQAIKSDIPFSSFGTLS